MGSFEMPGLRSLGVTRQNPLTLSSEAAKLSGFTLPNHKPPAPPGAAKSVDRSDSAPTPTKEFILDTIEERVGAPSPQRKIKEQLLDAGAGLLRKRDAELAKLQSKLPAVDVEEISRQRIERAAEESRKAKEQAEELTPETPEENKRPGLEIQTPSPAEASKAYKKLAELSPKPRSDEDPRPSAATLATQERQASSPRKDLAAGGASEQQKGDPGVNLVA